MSFPNGNYRFGLHGPPEKEYVDPNKPVVNQNGVYNDMLYFTEYRHSNKIHDPNSGYANSYQNSNHQHNNTANCNRIYAHENAPSQAPAGPQRQNKDFGMEDIVSQNQELRNDYIALPAPPPPSNSSLNIPQINSHSINGTGSCSIDSRHYAEGFQKFAFPNPPSKRDCYNDVLPNQPHHPSRPPQPLDYSRLYVRNDYMNDQEPHHNHRTIHQFTENNSGNEGLHSQPTMNIPMPQRRSRPTFDEEQLKVLEKSFQKSHYVYGMDRSRLAAQAGMTEKQVKIWFQNRRSKFRKATTTASSK